MDILATTIRRLQQALHCRYDDLFDVKSAGNPLLSDQRGRQAGRQWTLRKSRVRARRESAG
ncbi:MAG: hypothetical protein A3G75_06420 [Verrucomicrobia bacterium RIFCSPLOWO2_12_FULL_64_8]|nr:MAG: hypothetical protein A3G75_06420 [Verrucomicrobia bacterium RIFCSPLOWO2_12_FULL_64_8]